MTDVFVDVGRGHIRVVAPSVDVRTEPGAGLGDTGSAGAARIVARAVDAAVASSSDPRPPSRLVVGAPGVVTSAALAQAFADALADAFDPAAMVLVVSDSAAWQVGAFAGGDGAAVALGTGAVTVAREGDTVVRLDGRGLLLGDVGGGAWTGLQALRAADAAGDGVLHTMAVARFGPASGWPGLLGEPDLPARLAGFVPDVVDAAAGGDRAAETVLDDAAAAVADTLSAVPPTLPVCLVGGLAAVLAPRVRALADRPWQDPVGDAIDGLRLLLDDLGPFSSEAFRGRRSEASRASRTEDRPIHETDGLSTEGLAPDTTDLDGWPTERLVTRLVAGHDVAARAVLDAVAPLTRAAELAGSALAGVARLVYVGAGTPGRLAVQDAAELTPTFGLDPDRVPVLLAGGAIAGSTAVEGAEDDADAARRAIDGLDVGPADVVVGITASGRTPFVLAALSRAAQRGAPTVGICNVRDSPLAATAGIAVELLTGPEVIAGSTRLAAGTAQKIALNTISTAAMVRAGKTFGPWMVDMMASNDKLRRRAVRIVRDAAGVSDDAAVAALEAAGQSVRVALIMLLSEVGADRARDRLASAGSVRAALVDPSATVGRR